MAIAVGETSALGNDELRISNGGLSYDMRFVKLMGVVYHATFRDRKQATWLIGVSVPVGLHEFRANFERANASGGGTDRNDATQVALGYSYNVSKRTALYGTCVRLSNQGAAAFAVSNPPPSAAAGRHSSGFDLGIRHAF